MTTVVRESQTVVLNGGGEGTLVFTPLKAFENWHLTRLTVSGNSAIAAVKCRVYRGSESPENLLDSSEKANADVSETDLTLSNGEQLVVAFIDGSPGASMSFRCEGTII